MAPNRLEMIRLIDGMADDKVDTLLDQVRRMTAPKPRPAWPPRFVGMIKDGPTNGSSPEILDAR